MGIRFDGYSDIMDFLGEIRVIETCDFPENVISSENSWILGYHGYPMRIHIYFVGIRFRGYSDPKRILIYFMGIRFHG